METAIVNKIQFPEFTGIKCNMMPFIQGEDSSLPEIYKPYSKIINENYLERGEVGFLTIHESFVEANKSQRGYNSKGINRNVHIEVGRHHKINCWGGSGGSSWGGRYKTLLEDTTMVLIANRYPDLQFVSSAMYLSPNVGIVSSLKSDISITSLTNN